MSFFNCLKDQTFRKFFPGQISSNTMPSSPPAPLCNVKKTTKFGTVCHHILRVLIFAIVTFFSRSSPPPPKKKEVPANKTSRKYLPYCRNYIKASPFTCTGVIGSWYCRIIKVSIYLNRLFRSEAKRIRNKTFRYKSMNLQLVLTTSISLLRKDRLLLRY